MLEQQRSRLNSIYIFKVLWLNLRLKRKIQLALLPVLMLLSSFAELLTLAGIIPFLSIINNPDALQSNKFAAIIAELFDITEASQLIVYVASLFGILVVSAALLRLINLWTNSRLAASIGLDLSQTL